MCTRGRSSTAPSADWDFSFDLNVRSMFVMTKAMLPKMIAAGGGVILNMASVLGAHKAAPNRLAYAASKAAVAGFTRALAIDHVKQNIRVNCVCPGTVDTPSLGERIKAFADPVQARKDFIARQPMGRLATAEEIAETFVYLVSDESSFMTGQAIFVDGGMSVSRRGKSETPTFARSESEKIAGGASRFFSSQQQQKAHYETSALRTGRDTRNRACWMRAARSATCRA